MVAQVIAPAVNPAVVRAVVPAAVRVVVPAVVREAEAVGELRQRPVRQRGLRRRQHHVVRHFTRIMQKA